MDLTPEEFEDMIDFAIEEALERAFEGKLTMPGLLVFLTKYHVNTDKGRQICFSKLKEMGVKLYSNEGFGGSGRLNNKG